MKTKILTVIMILGFLNISVAQKYKFGKVSKEELLQKEHPTDTTADAAEKSSRQAELSNLHFENLNAPGQPVSLEYDFESLDAVEDVAGKLYFSPMMYLATKETPFKA